MIIRKQQLSMTDKHKKMRKIFYKWLHDEYYRQYPTVRCDDEGNLKELRPPPIADLAYMSGEDYETRELRKIFGL